MAVLAKSEITKMVKSGKLKIAPFKLEQIGAGSTDLHLGNEFRVFRSPKGVIDVSDNIEHGSISEIVKVGANGIILKPGQFINGITEESIKLPKNISGRIEGRSRFARVGLLVHVSSGFVQPGSDGRIVLEIANLSKVKLRLIPGIKICQIILEEVKGSGGYSGSYLHQQHP